MNEIYRNVLQRVEKANTKKPSPLRQQITELLINHPAVRPHDQCSPVSDKVARYKLANGAGLGHDYENVVQHWWVAADRLPSAFAPIAEAYAEDRARSSNVKCIPDIAMKAAYRVTLNSVSEAEQLLNALLAH